MRRMLDFFPKGVVINKSEVLREKGHSVIHFLNGVRPYCHIGIIRSLCFRFDTDLFEAV